MKHLFIVNPAAGGKDSTDFVSAKVAQFFSGKEGDFEIYSTKAPMDSGKKIHYESQLCDELRVYACGGAGEAIKFADCLRRGRNYYPEEELLQRIKDGLFVSVIGNDRLWSTIPNVYRAHGYVLGPLSALAYAGTMDHRAKTGENRHCVILSDKGALCDEDAVARSMGMDAARLRRILE